MRATTATHRSAAGTKPFAEPMPARRGPFARAAAAALRFPPAQHHSLRSMTHRARLVSFAVLGLSFGAAMPGAFAQGDIKRGLYISKSAGCVGCHTAEGKESPAYA